ncbi:MAG: peptide chain release factor N(5)-glutamine methyltransferase [Myxococcota bacterium]|nr:peptide chain release factor N(5)-glutamine methyltransferase [Myxococcota bacterium]
MSSPTDTPRRPARAGSDASPSFASGPEARAQRASDGRTARASGERSRTGRSGTSETWTVLRLLRWTTDHFAERGIETARLDAECLLAHALGVERLRLYLDFEKPVTPDERAVFRELVRRRGAERVPVALLLGRREFWSLPLQVSPDVLVPRPETETLVQAALDLLPPDSEARVLEIGTGSGAIALALASERPGIRITATDLSAAALELARRNADELHMADRIRQVKGHLFDPVDGETFDLVVSNPPYVAESQRADLPPELLHEPPGALFAGPDGTSVLRELVEGVHRVLAPGGALALELSPEQAPRVADWCRAQGLHNVSERRDLAGRVRVVAAAHRAEGGA